MKIYSLYKKSILLIVNCGVHPDDSMELKLQKQVLSFLPIIIGIAAAIWGSIYFHFEHYISASIPLSYSVISFFSLLYFSYSKDITFIRYSQLILVLLLPFLLMWSLGGFATGSYVMIWAFYAPLALISFSKKESITWLMLFLFLTGISFFIDNMLIKHIEPLPELAIRIFSLLNITAGFGGIFYIMYYYVKERDHISEVQCENEIILQKAKLKAELLTQEQSSLLSLFDKGDSVLFKWRNDDIWNVDYVSQNASRLLGFEIEEFTSNKVSYSSCIDKDDLENVLLEVTYAVENSLDFFRHKPYRVISKNGSVKWVLDYTVTQKDENGNITHFIGYITDITEQVIIQKELQQAKDIAEKANSSKSEFLANMSHEIRTPLNAILGFVDLLKDESKGRKSLEYINIIESSSKNLLKIIEDILDFSKIEKGKLDIDKIDFNAKAEFEVIINLYDAKASQKNITLYLNISENLPETLNTDPLRVKQVISNLLSNAIKFTSEGKNIYLNIIYKDKHLDISVKDEGKGIGKDKLSHIFESFSQEDNSTTREYGGTGLGLSISRELVKLLGGELKVNSTLKVGSEFYFSIPVGIGKNRTKLVESQKDINLKNKKILLVEDNKANQMFMKVILKKIGLKIDIANDGLEAVEAFKDKKYDSIFMDENMPNMNGIEATKEILKIEKENNLLHTPIIALTANALKGDRDKFLDAGMDEYLTKPLDKKKMIEVLRKFLLDE